MLLFPNGHQINNEYFLSTSREEFNISVKTAIVCFFLSTLYDSPVQSLPTGTQSTFKESIIWQLNFAACLTWPSSVFLSNTFIKIAKVRTVGIAPVTLEKIEASTARETIHTIDPKTPMNAMIPMAKVAHATSRISMVTKRGIKLWFSRVIRNLVPKASPRCRVKVPEFSFSETFDTKADNARGQH